MKTYDVVLTLSYRGVVPVRAESAEDAYGALGGTTADGLIDLLRRHGCDVRAEVEQLAGTAPESRYYPERGSWRPI